MKRVIALVAIVALFMLSFSAFTFAPSHPKPYSGGGGPDPCLTVSLLSVNKTGGNTMNFALKVEDDCGFSVGNLQGNAVGTLGCNVSNGNIQSPVVGYLPDLGPGGATEFIGGFWGVCWFCLNHISYHEHFDISVKYTAVGDGKGPAAGTVVTSNTASSFEGDFPNDDPAYNYLQPCN